MDVRFLSDSQLNEIAERYLQEHHPEGSIPIPVEDFLDLHHRVDIIPVHGMLDEDGVEGVISKDLRSIYIDNQIYCHRSPNKYRYTLAHELAHIVLHSNVVQSAAFTGVKSWKTFVGNISAHTYRRIEMQAYRWAGMLLVPSDQLAKQYQQLADQMSDQGLSIGELGPSGIKQVAKYLGDQFQVSSGVIHRRAVHEGLWTNNDAPDDI